MAWFAATIPIQRGQEARAKEIGAEFAERHARYEELNRAAGLKRHLEFIQETPMGAAMITVYEADDLSKLGRVFSDDAYDTWWTDRIKDIHGFDLRGPGASLPQVTLVHEWKAPGVS